MTQFSVQTWDKWIFKKGCGFLPFAIKMDKNIDKNISKKSSARYSQKNFYYSKQPAANKLKTTSKRVNWWFYKEQLPNLFVINFATKISKTLQRRNQGKVKTKDNEEVPRKIDR